jgi:hypothetical protein
LTHDELDVVTSAIVGVFFPDDRYEALGSAAEDPMIVATVDRPGLALASPDRGVFPELAADVGHGPSHRPGCPRGRTNQGHLRGPGEPVGAWNNTAWVYVNNSPPGRGGGRPNAGWLDEKFVDDGLNVDTYAAGVPAC